MDFELGWKIKPSSFLAEKSFKAEGYGNITHQPYFLLCYFNKQDKIGMAF